MSCLISFVSVEWMSSLFFIGGDRADPMPGKNERQGRSTNIFFFHEGSLQGHRLSAQNRSSGAGLGALELAFLLASAKVEGLLQRQKKIFLPKKNLRHGSALFRSNS